MNQQKSLLLFGGRICQELSRQPFLSKDYQVTYIDSLLNTQHYPDAVLPKEIGTDIRPDLLVIDFQAVIEELTGRLCSRSGLGGLFLGLGGCGFGLCPSGLRSSLGGGLLCRRLSGGLLHSRCRTTLFTVLFLLSAPSNGLS